MATAGGGRFFQFLRYYNHLLNRYKYPVQIATGGFLWGSGDLLCQTIVKGFSDDDDSDTQHHHHDQQESKDESKNSSFFDWSRTGRMTIYGLCFSAPTFAFWYGTLDKISHRIFAAVPPGSTVSLPKPLVYGINWWWRLRSRNASSSSLSILRKGTTTTTTNKGTTNTINNQSPSSSPPIIPFLIPGNTLRTWKIIGFKLVADTLIFDPLYLSLFFAMTSRMEGRSTGEIVEKLQADLLPTWLIDMAVWMPIQTINFRFVPVIYQALVVQSCNIGWNAYLSYVQHTSR